MEPFDHEEPENPKETGVPSGPWQGRVKFVDGPDGYAYRPGRVVVHGVEAWKAVHGLLGLDAPEPPDDLFGFYVVEGVGEGRESGLVSDLALAGFTAEPDYVLFAHCGGGCSCGGGCGSEVSGAGANPVYASPVYASPVYASPVYASPVYASPVYASPVYASPVYASPVYASGYRASGHRTSSARPASALDAGRLPAKWTGPARGPSVLVLDTGLAWRAPKPPYPSASLKQLPSRLERLGPPRSQDIDWPDGTPAAPGDGFLDPAAGHGTFIAGIIEGLAPGCRLGVGRVLGSYGDGSTADIAAYVDRLIADGGLHVGGTSPDAYEVELAGAIVNLSFGGYAASDMHLLAAMVRRLQHQGAVVVASAGNDGCCRPTYPAALPGVVGVGALGPCGPAPFTNHGPWVRACAPGSDIVNSLFLDWNGSVQPLDGGPDPDDFEGWARWSGTSFSAPIVAGVLAREMLVTGCTAQEAVGRVVDAPWLFRLPGLGTVVDVV